MDKVNEIVAVDLEELLRQDNQIVVIDVREAEEVALGMINESIHIPMSEIPHAIPSFDNEKHYILVCRSGSRSESVTKYLMKKGYHASNLVGGIIDWRGEIII